MVRREKRKKEEPMMRDIPHRDTQFLGGFAKLLYEDFLQLGRDDESSINEILAPDYPEKWRAKVEQLIAQRGYDFLVSSHYHTAMLDSWEESKQRVALVPDMTEWPDWSKA